MKLQDLFHNYLALVDDREILGIAYDSRKANKGDIFFAITGHKEDGKKYIPEAINRGVCAVIVDSLIGIEPKHQAVCIVVQDVREALAVASCNFFSNPSKNILLFGITGTKGKTSCTFLLASILEEAGHTVAMMGTVQCSYPGYLDVPLRTTSESYEIQKFLYEARNAGATAVVIEVSSHALSLDRVFGCAFDGVLFTNLSEDHLDYYQTIESYYQAKKKLFTEFTYEVSGKSIVGVTNEEDNFGKQLLIDTRMPVYSFGISNGDYKLERKKKNEDGRIEIDVKLKSGAVVGFSSSLANTQFNIENIIACIALADTTKIPVVDIQNGIKKLTEIPGRLSKIPTNLGFQVFVDFAHNGLALRSVLSALKESCKGRLIVVFGAGGEKDPQRRVGLGEAAADLAEISVVTSDNPRGEDPKKIIAAIVSAWENRIQVRKNNERSMLYVEEDRGLAIRYALGIAKKDDVVCIAGKGHERGQIIGTVVIPFDDSAVATEELRKLENVCR